MDSSAAPHCYHHLAGLPPYHIDSHTMGDHEDEIPELYSPPHEVGEEEPIITYDASHEKP